MGKEEEYSKKFNSMKKDLGLTNKDVAEITGNQKQNIDNTTGPKASFPRWAKLAIWVHEFHLDKK